MKRETCIKVLKSGTVPVSRIQFLDALTFLSILCMTTYFSAKLLFYYYFKLRLEFLDRAPQLGQATSTASRTGEGAERCGHLTIYIYVLHMRSMYKIDRRGRGGVQNCVIGNYQFKWPFACPIQNGTLKALSEHVWNIYQSLKFFVTWPAFYPMQGFKALWLSVFSIMYFQIRCLHPPWLVLQLSVRIYLDELLSITRMICLMITVQHQARQQILHKSSHI